MEGKTLDLAYYKSLNAILKEHALLKKIDEKVALEYVETLSLVFKALNRQYYKVKKPKYLN